MQSVVLSEGVTELCPCEEESVLLLGKEVSCVVTPPRTEARFHPENVAEPEAPAPAAAGSERPVLPPRRSSCSRAVRRRSPEAARRRSPEAAQLAEYTLNFAPKAFLFLFLIQFTLERKMEQETGVNRMPFLGLSGSFSAIP